MAEVIAFPDVEDLVRTHLADTLKVAAYAGTTAQDLPDRSVTVVRTGGIAQNLVTDAAMVSVDCRSGRSEQDAAHLAQLARAHLRAAEHAGWLAGVPLYRVAEIAGPYLNADPRNPTQHRYSATYQVTVRGQVI